jgi:RNA polymerase-associated protein CTR9
MVQQKAGEMIIGLPVHKRTLEELKQGLEHASQSQQVFAALAEDKSTDGLPYSRDLAKQRQLYGQSLLRKGADQEAQQEKHESEHRARRDAARAIRDAERAEREAREAQRLEELRRRAEELAEERRRAREVAQEWSAAMKAESSEDEKVKKKRGRRAGATASAAAAAASAAAAAAGDGDGGGDESASESEKPRRSKKPRIRRGKGKESAPGSDEGGLFSAGAEEEEKKPKESRKVRIWVVAKGWVADQTCLGSGALANVWSTTTTTRLRSHRRNDCEWAISSLLLLLFCFVLTNGLSRRQQDRGLDRRL